MPSELRVIRFKLDEVAAALRKLGPRLEIDFPEGDITSAVCKMEDGSQTTSLVINGGDQSVVISNGKLAAGLIHDCINGGIPLPREGQKEIYVAPKFVELRIVLRHRDMDAQAEASNAA